MIRNILLVATLLTVSVSFADKKMKGAAKAGEAKETFKLIHVADLADWMQTKKDQVFVFDANNDDTRKKDGVIPGAKILATSSQYDVSQMLPADKSAKLVFYCANTRCMASHDAAKRATEAGYKDVNVMADGIEGWKKAGKSTEKFSAAKDKHS